VLWCVLAACGLSPAPRLSAPGQSVAPAATATRRPARDDVILVIPTAPSPLARPPRASADPAARAAREIDNLTMAALVANDGDGNLIPDLAERVPTLENGGARWVGTDAERHLEVTFTLRPDARWSDGRGVTAADVLLSWHLALQSGDGQEVNTVRRIERIETPDPRTVRLRFFSERSAREAAARTPNEYGFLEDQVGAALDRSYARGLPGAWIYPAHLFPDRDPRETLDELLARKGYDRAPVGAGPYRLLSASGGEIVLEARPEYHRGSPAIRRVIVRPLAGAARVLELSSGRIDLAQFDGADAGGLDALRASAEVTVGPIVATADHEVLRFRPGSTALRDRRVRLAIAALVDREALATERFGARAAVVAVAAVPTIATRDVARAERLLREAAWTPGNVDVPGRGEETPTLRLLTTDDAPRRRTAELLAAQLAPHQIRLDARFISARTLFAAAGPLRAGEYDLTLHGVVGADDPADDLIGPWIPALTEVRPVDSRIALLPGRLDAAIEEAALNDVRRAEGELRDEILPEVPLFAYPRVVAHRADLRGPAAPARAIGLTWNAATWARP